MSEEKFTKGPWIRIPASCSIIENEDGTVPIAKVQEVVANDRVTANNLRMANANLISAAPELYAACEDFIQRIQNGDKNMTTSYDLMKAATAKARGEA